MAAHLTAEQRQLALRLKARRKVGKPRGQARPHQQAVRFPAPAASGVCPTAGGRSPSSVR
jgi:hypothetical protein